jgi:hypothetical protein
LAYGIGGLTPAEFGDLTPAEFVPYINARIEREKELIKMDNERIGTICAILQNGIPIGFIKKGAKVHHPSEYFGSVEKRSADPTERKGKIQGIYDTMMAWVSATKGGK